MAQQPVNQPGGVLGFLQDVAINTSDVGNDLIRLGQNLNNDFVNVAGQSSDALDQTGATIRANLAAGKKNEIGERLINWISSPQNLIFSVIGVLATILLIRKL